mgnify:CR=1 FL=1
MKLFLYDVDDGDNVINKTLPVPVEIEIRLSNDVDVTNPTIRLRNVEGINYDDYNYAFIDVLGRYYFIDKLGRVSASDNMLYLSCDVLETYKDEILSSNARFKRSIKTGDYYDGEIDKSIKKTILNYNSDVTITPKASFILTTVGD